jgi:hypothetical protein
MLVLSLALDSVVAMYCNKALSLEPAQFAAAIAALCTLPFLNQAALARTLAKARRFQNNSGKSNRLPQRIAVSFIILLIVGIKLAFLPTLNSFVAIVVAMIILLWIASGVQHVIRGNRERSRTLARSPWLHVVLWERQIVLLFILPMISARLISMFGALSLGNATSPAFAVVAMVASIILLAALRPERSAFIGWCPSCRSPAPIAFVEYGSCPRCDEHLAQNT